MSPMLLMNSALFDESGAGFTVNVWLRSGVEFRNLNVLFPTGGFSHARDTHFEAGRQEQPGASTLVIAFDEVAALEVEW